MENTLDFYKEQFEKVGKAELFEINKPFIEEIILVKNKITKLNEISNGVFIEIHPEYPTVQRVPEIEKWILKLQQHYKEMTATLNKIIGPSAVGDEDPLAKWLETNAQHD